MTSSCSNKQLFSWMNVKLNAAWIFIRFNPDVFSPGVKHHNPEGDFFKKQCNLVKDASDFLLNVQIPAFLRECRDHSAAPMDGQTLSDNLHNRGINIRYLGIIANLLSVTPGNNNLVQYLLNWRSFNILKSTETDPIKKISLTENFPFFAVNITWSSHIINWL